MEHTTESGSADVGQQTDEESHEMVNAVEHVGHEPIFHDQEQHPIVESKEVQNLDQKEHIENDDPSVMLEDQQTDQKLVEIGDEPAHSTKPLAQKQHSAISAPAQPEFALSQESVTEQLSVGDSSCHQAGVHTATEDSNELQERTNQAPMVAQEDIMQAFPNFKEDDNLFPGKQEPNPQQSFPENHEFENKMSSDVSSATATVKVMFAPNGQVVTVAFSIGNSVGNLKKYFASQMKIPEMVIQIMFEGRIVEDHETLVDLGITPHGTIQLDMQSLDHENYPIKAMKFQHDYNMPDVITVRVQTGEETYEDIAVEIERLNYRKPYLGGYRHKATGVVFHHAGTQTVPKKRPDREVVVFCRDTQTVFEKNKIQQSSNTMSTQMTKIGCYVANITDKLLQPKKYLTADEFHAKRLKAVVIIQTYFRRFHAKRVVEQLREEKRLRVEWEEREEFRKKKEKEERLRKEYLRRMNPKTKEDFDLLYHALESWRKEEVEKINQTYSGAERKAALCALLDQETQLIASIGRHRLDAGEENHEKAIHSLLNKCSEPKKWKAVDGKTTEMDTQFTIRARQLRDIYTSINTKCVNNDERLDTLLTLKHTVKEHDCKLTQEIVELIDREADLLMRGVKNCNLDGLRKRISTLFLQYIKIPTFNPEIARLLKVPQDSAFLRKNIYFCPCCESYLPSTEFSLSANARTVGRCRKCSKLDNEGRQREEFSKYRILLKQLKKSEASYGDDAKIAFLLQQEDLQYLVDNIWAAHSALSACDDLYDLVMVRWDKYYEWSPWNCVLLTKEEAAAHLKLANAEQAYGIVFIRKIKHRHTLAKNYFSQIPEMAPFLHQEKSNQMSTVNDLVISKPIAASFQV
ncbi:IQ motif and ubiquitin-like domain-containing protein [Mixophyes fleayi]|uniref:IQ motif and ubiquitin-like domain-containing protein n=1 Tax=Mixophyes fleayi TaxID=3061075 RepID=UPI003F4DDCE5